MQLKDKFYQPNSYGHYKLWANDDGLLSHFGWEAPSDLNYDKSEHGYTVYRRDDFASEEEMIKSWESKKSRA